MFIPTDMVTNNTPCYGGVLHGLKNRFLLPEISINQTSSVSSKLPEEMFASRERRSPNHRQVKTKLHNHTCTTSFIPIVELIIWSVHFTANMTTFPSQQKLNVVRKKWNETTQNKVKQKGNRKIYTSRIARNASKTSCREHMTNCKINPQISDKN